MNIQWYPGHMTKAKRAMEENVKVVDLIIEIVDARAPGATRNPDLAALGRGKDRLIILNKADLAEPEGTERWAAWFASQGIRSFVMDARSRRDLKGLLRAIEEASVKKKARDQARGILNRPVRAMAAGIPNVGKSTLINTIAGRTAARTGNRPGVTKGTQWIRLGKSVELLDTPGILWPKFEDPEIGLMIAFLGSIGEMAVDQEELAGEFFRFLERTGRTEGFTERYGTEPSGRPEEVLSRIALKRSLLLAGGLPDTRRAASAVLEDFRAGRLGRICLELPGKL